MNRILSALFSALEALIVVAIGIAIPLVPLTILWGAQYGFAPNWLIFWRTSADIWMVGHGADLYVTLDHATVVSSGLTGAGDPFVVTIAALGFALVTVMLGARAGRRIAETQHRLLGEIVAIVIFALLSLAIAVSAVHPLARVSITQGAVLPTMVFALGLLIGHARRMDGEPDGPVRRWFTAWPREWRVAVSTAARGGAAAVATIVAVACVLIAILLVANYAQIITLYEDLHSGSLGGIGLTIAEIMVLPTLVIWGISWIVGPGFAIGAGSSISPLATTVGPVPAIPVLGALPHGQFAFGLVVLLVPVIAGFLAGAVLSRSLVAGLGAVNRISAVNRITWSLCTGMGMGVVGGAVLGALAWMSAGSIGPGRLQVAGPDPVTVAVFGAVEIGVAAVLGIFAAARQR